MRNANARKTSLLYAFSLAIVLGITGVTVHAESQSSSSSSSPPSGQQTELDAAFQAAGQALKKGPTDIPIANQGTLKLPVGYGFVPPQEAQRLLEAMGNRTSDGLQGMIFSLGDQSDSWFIVINYSASGYVKDDDARNWNADELLQSIRAGTEETNEARRARGIPEMEVGGWVEKPHYDTTTHQVVWSLSSRDKGQVDTADNGINYNTLTLGREGFISMNLVTNAQAVEGLKPMTQTLLAALSFNEGKRYADYNASTDKVAEYGLTALIAGVAAKKLGLLAVIAAFAAKFAKVIVIAALAGSSLIAKLFKKKKQPDSSQEVA